MATTYTLIASNTLGTATSSLTFSSIPSTYTDLVLRMSARCADAQVVFDIGVVFATGVLYSFTSMQGNGATASSTRSGSMQRVLLGNSLPGSSATASTFSNIEVYIPNYAATTSRPIGSLTASENAATTAYVVQSANLYTGTSAITDITINQPLGSNFVAGSSFYLYGIKKN